MKLSVVLVEDDDDAQVLFKRFVRRNANGVTVELHAFSTFDELCDAVEQGTLHPEDVHIWVSDFELPGGHTGREVLQYAMKLVADRAPSPAFFLWSSLGAEEGPIKGALQTLCQRRPVEFIQKKMFDDVFPGFFKRALATVTA